MKEITTQESEALLKSIVYWVENWDFECPILFGLEKSEMEGIAKSWPISLTQNANAALLACLGSLREILYGASSLQKSEVLVVLGITYSQASELCEEIHAECKRIL